MAKQWLLLLELPTASETRLSRYPLEIDIGPHFSRIGSRTVAQRDDKFIRCSWSFIVLSIPSRSAVLISQILVL